MPLYATRPTVTVVDQLQSVPVVVTGAAGFVGANLIQALTEKCEASVVGVVRPTSDLSRLRRMGGRARIVSRDLAEVDPSELAELVGPAQTVFHLAAAGIHARISPTELVAANVRGTAAALELANCIGARRFVYAGSCFEYGDAAHAREDGPLQPTSEYGASKVAGGLMAQAVGRQTGLEVAWLRLYTVYGPLERPARLVPSVLMSALTRRPLGLTGGDQGRDFLYVDDAVDALIVAAVAEAAAGELFNICTGVETKVRELVELVSEITNSPVPALLGERPYRSDEMWHQSGDPARAAEVLGWRARVTLRDGLVRTMAALQGSES